MIEKNYTLSELAEFMVSNRYTANQMSDSEYSALPYGYTGEKYGREFFTGNADATASLIGLLDKVTADIASMAEQPKMTMQRSDTGSTVNSWAALRGESNCWNRIRRAPKPARPIVWLMVPGALRSAAPPRAIAGRMVAAVIAADALAKSGHSVGIRVYALNSKQGSKTVATNLTTLDVKTPGEHLNIETIAAAMRPATYRCGLLCHVMQEKGGGGIGGVYSPQPKVQGEHRIGGSIEGTLPHEKGASADIIKEAERIIAEVQAE